MSKPYTIACYYFPNYHVDPRNAMVHGPGWSEWALVQRAEPRFPGHRQPCVPRWGYENEADPSVMAKKISAAADHGVDILCQKPFAGSLETARQLIEHCSARGVTLGIHENFRWQQAVRRTIEALRDGAIGRPFFGRISYRSGFDVYRAQPYLAEVERFIIEDLGIHVLDIARALFGEVDRLGCEIA